MSDESTIRNVRDQYGAVARSGLSNDLPAVRAVAAAFGYAPQDLDSLPPQANMGLSCGNPVAVAGLREGEVVVDLGCGGGLDVFLAAHRVGSTGKVIGIDMTPEMIDRARAGAAALALNNVEFHLAQIDQLPLPENSVDCVISNCVINLVPDKSRAFREILRVLKPGGRMVISDIALKQPFPESVRQDVQAYVGCIAGAIQIGEYQRMLSEAGLADVVVQDTGANLNAYAEVGASGCCSSDSCCSPNGSTAADSPVHDGLAELIRQFDANQYAASVRVHALKPSPSQSPEYPVMTAFASKTIVVYDRPMCCPTGVCGPQVDPTLPRFAADLDWLKSHGHTVHRYNLAQQPQAFVQNADLRQLLSERGVDVLPVIAVDGQVVSSGDYPTRQQLALWAGVSETRSVLPVVDKPSAGCCAGSNCC